METPTGMFQLKKRQSFLISLHYTLMLSFSGFKEIGVRRFAHVSKKRRIHSKSINKDIRVDDWRLDVLLYPCMYCSVLHEFMRSLQL